MTNSLIRKLTKSKAKVSDQNFAIVPSGSLRNEGSLGLDMIFPQLHDSVEGLILNLSKKSGFEQMSAEVRALGHISTKLARLKQTSFESLVLPFLGEHSVSEELWSFAPRIRQSWEKILKRPKSSFWKSPRSWFRKEKCLVPDLDAISQLYQILSRCELFMSEHGPVTDVMKMRRDRWERLNCVIIKRQQKNNIHGPVGFSHITGNEIDGVFHRHPPYQQEYQALGNVSINSIIEYTSVLHSSIGSPLDDQATEATRLQFIAIIINVVVGTLKTARSFYERPLKGKYIYAHGRFEIVIEKGDRVICVVEVKKSDIHAGTVQTIVGTEVAAEEHHSRVVYGIVSTYDRWIFIRNRYDGIATELFIPNLRDGRLEADSLDTIAGKIFAMLNDPWEYSL